MQVQSVSALEYNALNDNLITGEYSDNTVGVHTEYNLDGTVKSVTDALGNTMSYTYDILGNKSTETLPNGAVTEYEYDDLNRPTKIYFRDNASASRILMEEYAYTILLDGKTETSTTTYHDYGIGYTTTVQYDELGRQIKTTNPDGSIYETVYNENGTVQKEIDPSGTEISYTYDKLGRAIQVSRPFEIIDTVKYDSIAKTTYDNNGQALTKETLNNAPGELDTYSKTEYVYNDRGLLETIKLFDDGVLENVTQYYYDEEGRTVRMYTGLDSPLTITGLDIVSGSDTNYSVIKSEYNNLGQLVKMINPVGYETTYEYDLNGNIIKSVDPESTEFHYEYDLNGSLLREYTITLDGEGQIDYLYTYNSLGNRLTMIDAHKTTTYVYDIKGQLVSETDTLGSDKSYTYDLRGNRKTLLAKYNGSVVQDISYNYDNMGRMTQVLDGVTVKTTYTYDINGNRTVMTYDNGNHTDYTYNLANSLKTITNYDDITVISGETYNYYLSGNIKDKTDNDGRITSYLYDDLSRLNQESILIGTEETDINYVYDDYNNRIAKQVVDSSGNYSIHYYYDDMNRLDSEIHSVDGMTTYTYDKNGNTLTTVSPTETISYDYNSLNEIISVDKGNKISIYAYDGNRLRINKTVDGATTTQFLNDAGSVFAEVESNAVTRSYLRGINLIAELDGTGSYNHYFVFNYHGDVTELTDITGEVIKSYKYDAFGIEENMDGLDNNPFRYTGEYFDKETNTIYLRARYYNPTNGRFVNQDSYLGNTNDPLSLNLYTYVHNNPIINVDSTGHSADRNKYRKELQGYREEAREEREKKYRIVKEYFENMANDAELQAELMKVNLATKAGELKANILRISQKHAGEGKGVFVPKISASGSYILEMGADGYTYQGETYGSGHFSVEPDVGISAGVGADLYPLVSRSEMNDLSGVYTYSSITYNIQKFKGIISVTGTLNHHEPNKSFVSFAVSTPTKKMKYGTATIVGISATWKNHKPTMDELEALRKRSGR